MNTNCMTNMNFIYYKKVTICIIHIIEISNNLNSKYKIAKCKNILLNIFTYVKYKI